MRSMFWPFERGLPKAVVWGKGYGMTNRMTTALLAAIRHTTEPMVLADAQAPDVPMIAVNGAFETLSGYARTEIVGRNCRFLQGSGTDAATRRRIGAALRAGQGCIEWIVNHRKNGSAFWNLLFISPVGPVGAPTYFLGNQMDITAGLPEWMDGVVFGRARMSPAVQAEFDATLESLADRGTDPVQALNRGIAAARRLAELSTSLEPVAVPAGALALPGWLTAGSDGSGRGGPAAS